ncbi:carbohydrate ABC transporter permease [Embleya sp. NPDC059237]|uniref:carbohydrate ABC transporter permease n=1 Tax=Embleya sp. NPDC059237 TaxID=3346784 RepID=UPI0036C1B1E3
MGGLDNYRMLLHDQQFLTTLRVTAILTLIVVILPNVPGLLIALLLDKRGRFHNAMRSVFFTPMILGSVAVSVIRTVCSTRRSVRSTRCWARSSH